MHVLPWLTWQLSRIVQWSETTATTLTFCPCQRSSILGCSLEEETLFGTQSREVKHRCAKSTAIANSHSQGWLSIVLIEWDESFHILWEISFLHELVNEWIVVVQLSAILRGPFVFRDNQVHQLEVHDLASFYLGGSLWLLSDDIEKYHTIWSITIQL